MRAGFSQIDFTPIEGFMPGEGLPFWAWGTRCPLLASAAAFAGEEESVILVSADLLLFSTARANDLRARIGAATGVPTSHIMLAATHTHTGASDYAEFYGTPGEPEVAAYVDACIVKAATEAYQRISDGFSVGTGKGIENRMSFNRDCVMDDGSIVSIPGAAAKDHIVGYLGTVDTDVHVMRVDNAAGEAACFIVNYANHPDNHNTHRNEFSADFPGYLRNNLQRAFGKDTVVLFFNGACGDVNAYNYKSGVSERYASPVTYMAEEIGNMLAETVFAIHREIKVTATDIPIKAVVRTDTYQKRVPAAWEIEQALATKAHIEAGERLRFEERYAADAALSFDPASPDITVEMQGIRLGDWRIITTPGETYTEIGLAIKALAPDDKILVSELTNGWVGYVCPDSTLGTAAYGACYYSGAIGHGAKDKMVATAKALLQELA